MRTTFGFENTSKILSFPGLCLALLVVCSHANHKSLVVFVQHRVYLFHVLKITGRNIHSPLRHDSMHDLDLTITLATFPLLGKQEKTAAVPLTTTVVAAKEF